MQKIAITCFIGLGKISLGQHLPKDDQDVSHLQLQQEYEHAYLHLEYMPSWLLVQHMQT